MVVAANGCDVFGGESRITDCPQCGVRRRRADSVPCCDRAAFRSIQCGSMGVTGPPGLDGVEGKGEVRRSDLTGARGASLSRGFRLRTLAIAAASLPLVAATTAGSAAIAARPQTARHSGAAFVPPGPYTAVAPFRICDTRPVGQGATTANQCDSGSGPHGPLGQGATRTITAGVSGSNVPPSGVSAVVVNVTAIVPSVTTFLTLYPSDGAKPQTSNMTPGAGQVVANLVEVAVSSSGQFNLFNANGTTNVAIDIEGYVSTTTSGTAGFYNPTTPTRICDTRVGTGITVNQCDRTGAKPILAGHPLTFDVHASGSPVPATGVSAVVFNLTAIAPSTGTVLTAYPSGGAEPTASNLNVPAGAIVPNRVVVPVPAGCAAPNCTVTIANGAGSANVAVDIDGWYTDSSGTTGSLFSAVAPSRLCDTRNGNVNDPGCAKAPVSAGLGGVLDIQIAGKAGVPAMSSSSPPVAVVVNVTAVKATTGTFVSAYSSDASGPPGVSDLNVQVGQADTNLVVVQVGSDGYINLYNAAGNVDLIVDVFGYYS